MDRSAGLLYNLAMQLPHVARMIRLRGICRTLPNLGQALPPDLIVGLFQRVNTLSHQPRQLANRLITHSGCRLRELQHAMPTIRVSPRKLFASLQSQGEEADLIRALVEFYVGLILLILFPGPTQTAYRSQELPQAPSRRLAPPHFAGRAKPVIPH